MRAGTAAYLAVLAAAAAAVTWPRPERAPAPDVAGRPMPELAHIEGLRLEAVFGLPRLRAARARPLAAGGPITVAGAMAGLELEDVRAVLGGGAVLTAERGELAGARLRLGPCVRVLLEDRPVLVSAEARVAAGEIVFPGIAALLAPAGGARRVRHGWRVPWQELGARLRH